MVQTWLPPHSMHTPFLVLPVKTRGSLPARSLVLLCCGGRRTGRPKGCSRFSRSPRALCCPCACYLLLSCCGWRARTKGTAPPRSPRPSRWPRCPLGRAPPPAPADQGAYDCVVHGECAVRTVLGEILGSPVALASSRQSPFSNWYFTTNGTVLSQLQDNAGGGLNRLGRPGWR